MRKSATYFYAQCSLACVVADVYVASNVDAFEAATDAADADTVLEVGKKIKSRRNGHREIDVFNTFITLLD